MVSLIIKLYHDLGEEGTKAFSQVSSERFDIRISEFTDISEVSVTTSAINVIITRDPENVADLQEYKDKGFELFLVFCGKTEEVYDFKDSITEMWSKREEHVRRTWRWEHLLDKISTYVYNEIFQNTFITLSNVVDGEDDDISDIIEPLCRFLRIGKIEETVHGEITGRRAGGPGDKPRNIDIYNSFMADEMLCVDKSDESRMYNIADFRFFGITGQELWSRDELHKIDAFHRMLYIFSAHRLMIVKAEKLGFYDSDMFIHNQNFYNNYVTKLIRDEMIDGYCAIYFNIRRLSVINQQVGRERGTLVLIRYINILKECLSSDETICRVTGDNFIMLVRKDNIDIISEILLGRPVTYNDTTGERVNVSCYVGAYMIDPKDNIKKPSDIQDRCQQALRSARMHIDNVIVYFDKNFEKRYRKELEAEALFVNAIKNEEFIVNYQPKVDMNDMSICGAEALSRWNRDGRIIQPLEFIPLLESSVAVCTHDFYMLDKVCRDIRGWIDSGIKPVPVSVNFSKRHLADVDFVENVLRIIDKYNVPHEYIACEMCEDPMDPDFEKLRTFVKRLNKAGITTVSDNYGAGSTSLKIITDIPWKSIKIDRTFVPHDTDSDYKKKTLVFNYVISMIKGLGMDCVIEGVETKEQIRLIQRNYCRYVQGFFFDKPLSSEDFKKKLSQHNYSEKM